jgi:adenosylmethionine-8-amino-7-oxononanoate aminotransferase
MESKRGNIWHPFTQMKLAPEPIEIAKGKGTILTDVDGKEYIDAISSWWVNIHGHSHPDISERVYQQLNTLEHCIFAGFTHTAAEELSENLLKVLPDNQGKLFFSDNGSTSVEVGVKMAIQYWHNQGVKKGKIVALKGAYHGDTFGAMSTGERSPFSAAFDEFMFDVHHVAPPMSVKDDSLGEFEGLCSSGEVLCFIYEPLVQGAGGMNMYSKEGLQTMLDICDKHDVVKIADEVMTGFGRTGKLFASEYMSTLPDIMCMSKGLTGGTLPMSITSCSEKIYDAFYSDDKMKTFFHGHSFTGNPVGCAASLASLEIMNRKETWESIKRIENAHNKFKISLNESKKVENIRIQGTILAFDIKNEGETSYFNKVRDQLYKFFIENGVLLRPLGNVVYFMPPYCITDMEMDKVYKVILDGLEEV